MSNERLDTKDTVDTKIKNNRPIFVSIVLSVLGLVAVVGEAGAQPNYPTAIPQTKFDSGQDIQPYFEGWIRNADGTFDLVFGYFNRNYVQEFAIAAGPDNFVEAPSLNTTGGATV